MNGAGLFQQPAQRPPISPGSETASALHAGVPCKNVFACGRDLGATTSISATNTYYERLAKQTIHIPHQHPGAIVGHSHLSRGSPDRTGGSDQPEEFGFAGPECLGVVARKTQPGLQFGLQMGHPCILVKKRSASGKNGPPRARKKRIAPSNTPVSCFFRDPATLML